MTEISPLQNNLEKETPLAVLNQPLEEHLLLTTKELEILFLLAIMSTCHTGKF